MLGRAGPTCDPWGISLAKMQPIKTENILSYMHNIWFINYLLTGMHPPGAAPYPNLWDLGYVRIPYLRYSHDIHS